MQTNSKNLEKLENYVTFRQDVEIQHDLQVLSAVH